MQCPSQHSMKPFKPPTVIGRQPLPQLTVSDLPQLSSKKRAHDITPNYTPFKKAKIQSNGQPHDIDKDVEIAKKRRPTSVLQETPASQIDQPPRGQQDIDEVYYSVLWYVVSSTADAKADDSIGESIPRRRTRPGTGMASCA